jgi:hypothetical protein
MFILISSLLKANYLSSTRMPDLKADTGEILAICRGSTLRWVNLLDVGVRRSGAFGQMLTGLSFLALPDRQATRRRRYVESVALRALRKECARYRLKWLAEA